MKDILDNEVQNGDIIVYTTLSARALCFGIVVENNRKHGHSDYRLGVRPLTTISKAADIFQTKQSTKEKAPTVSVDPKKAWVVQNEKSLPPKMVKVLKEAYNVRVQQGISAEARKEAYKGKSASERYKMNLSNVVQDNLFEQMQNDVMTIK